MVTGLIITACVIAILALATLLPISVRFYLQYNVDVEGILVVKYTMFPIFTLPIPPPEEQEKNEKPKKKPKQYDKEKKFKDTKKRIDIKEVLGFLYRNRSPIKRTIVDVLHYTITRSIKIKMLRLRLVMGVEDAMDTAMMFGAASGVIFNIVGLLDRHMRLGKHDVNIKPAFNEPHIFAETDVIISTCVFNFLVIGAIAIKHATPIAIRFWKEIIKNGKSNQRPG